MKISQTKYESAIRELVRQLEHAITCIEYCRANHPDPQTNMGGIPVEVFFRDSIAKAKVLL